jgi:hypothetical protein
MDAATTNVTNISVGALNARTGAAIGDVDNAPYYVQIVESDGSIEIVNSLTKQVVYKMKTIAEKALVANQAFFALAPQVALSIGTTLAIVNYNATGEGCTVQKIDTTNGDYQDWMVISTTAKASTGTIGVNPI